jgi:hypothetical protein
MKNMKNNLNLNLNLDWNKNIDYGSEEQTYKKLMIIIGVGCALGIVLTIGLAGFLYGIQQKTVEQGKLSYAKLFIIIIAPCILLGLIAGILLL